MNWDRRMEDWLGAWTGMQQRLWDGWLQAVNSFSGQTARGGEAWKQEYRQRLEDWERSVHRALEAQNRWARQWAGRLGAEGEAPDVVRQWVLQMQNMMSGWTAAQAQLWSAWFESVKHLDPEEVAERWENEGQQVLQAWEEAAQRAQDTLSEMSKEAVKETEG